MRFGIPKAVTVTGENNSCGFSPCPGKQAHAGPEQLTATNQNAFLASVENRHLTDLNFCCGRETGLGTNFLLRAVVLSADFALEMLK